MVNLSWREDVEMSEMNGKCVHIDCPCRQQRLDCQWEAAMATAGNACWHPQHRAAWLLTAEAEEEKDE